MLDPLFTLDHVGERPKGMTQGVGTVAGRLAATAVGQGERAGKGVGGNLKTGDKLALTPPKTAGRRGRG
jgi:hypothetical protein